MTKSPARIGKDHRVTIPAEVFAAAGLKAGDGLRVRHTGDRRLVVERVVYPMEEIEIVGINRPSGDRRYAVERVIHPMEEIEIVGVKRWMTFPSKALEAAGLQQGDILKMYADPKTSGVINIDHPDS
jgi:bifunctional DNA-binding transcriptional regulator/antitoxin component of YhaV-PrlF toxin-antitoxin module